MWRAKFSVTNICTRLREEVSTYTYHLLKKYHRTGSIVDLKRAQATHSCHSRIQATWPRHCTPTTLSRHDVTHYCHSCAQSTYTSPFLLPSTLLPLSSLPESSAAANPPPVSPSCLPFDEAMNNSSSRMNFAANINRRVFTLEERAIANVQGKAGKALLDPERINYINNTTFKLCPVEEKKPKQQHGVVALMKLTVDRIRPRNNTLLAYTYVVLIHCTCTALHLLVMIVYSSCSRGRG